MAVDISQSFIYFAEIYFSIMRSKVVTLLLVLLVSLFSSQAASGQWTEHDYLVSSASGRDDEEATGVGHSNILYRYIYNIITRE